MLFLVIAPCAAVLVIPVCVTFHVTVVTGAAAVPKFGVYVITPPFTPVPMVADKVSVILPVASTVAVAASLVAVKAGTPPVPPVAQFVGSLPASCVHVRTAVFRESTALI